VLKKTEPFYEVSVVGKNAPDLIEKMQKDYRPNIIWAYTNKDSSVPVFKNRYVNNKTLIYVCREGECQLPATNINEAFAYLK
jgi:uncharacterized protein YyaL (SSP411 family)